MSRQYAISVMSQDRPGIIADITGVIYEFGGDLADLNQSVLKGYFTMILIARFGRDVTASALAAGFRAISSKSPLDATIKEIEVDWDHGDGKLPEETYIVTAKGNNRKGLVKLLGDFFFVRNINVLDLVTATDDKIYTMIFQVDLGHILSLKTLREDLGRLGEDEELDLVLQHNDIYMATNEVGTTLDSIMGK